MDTLQGFMQKALTKSDDDNPIDISSIITCYNNYIKENHPRVNRLDRRRLEHLISKIYGIKSIKDDCLTGYKFTKYVKKYNNNIDDIINELNIKQ